jgi:hypothetical protein
VGFSWQDCGAKTYPDHVTALTVSPDPVHVPGKIIHFPNINSNMH